MTTVQAQCRTYDTQTAATILGVSAGLLYKIARQGPKARPEYRRYGCQKIGRRVTWSTEAVDAAAPARQAA
jgi:hypothetical protein